MKLFKKDIFKYLLNALLAFNISSVFADVDNSDPQLNAVFVRGSNLVYDCNGENLVCASQRSLLYCTGYNPADKPCKLIKKFQNESKCNQVQLELTSDNFTGEFCSN